ncbi:MAG: hypothetical protein QGG54_01135 [Gammaproteobacteria bacterium]|nr:hypothetical protein [Gammaproteobacteria bacterium]
MTQVALEFQQQELLKMEAKANLYEQKMAALRELVNVFLVALLVFVGSWVPLLLYEVQPLQQATWTAISIAASLAVLVLLVYTMLYNNARNKSREDLYRTRMSLGVGGMPMQPQGWMPQIESRMNYEMPSGLVPNIPPPLPTSQETKRDDQGRFLKKPPQPKVK